jgi:signal transduction histidine kinase
VSRSSSSCSHFTCLTLFRCDCPDTREAIVLESNYFDAFQQEDLELVKILAQHVEIALRTEEYFRKQGERQTREKIARLASGVLHEIGNNIALIPDLVDEIRETLDDSGNCEPIDGCLHEIQHYAESTCRIADKLNEIAKHGEIKLASVQIDALVKNILRELTPSIPSRIQLEYQPQDALPIIEVDQFWVELILKNLINNAFDVIPPLKKGQITIKSWLESSFIHISVEDNGRGMAESVLNKIFTGFTSKEDRLLTHGIGLRESREMARAWGGDLYTGSQEGEGSTLTLLVHMSLPVSKGD